MFCIMNNFNRVLSYENPSCDSFLKFENKELETRSKMFYKLLQNCETRNCIIDRLDFIGFDRKYLKSLSLKEILEYIPNSEVLNNNPDNSVELYINNMIYSNNDLIKLFNKEVSSIGLVDSYDCNLNHIVFIISKIERFIKSSASCGDYNNALVLFNSNEGAYRNAAIIRRMKRLLDKSNSVRSFLIKNLIRRGVEIRDIDASLDVIFNEADSNSAGFKIINEWLKHDASLLAIICSELGIDDIREMLDINDNLTFSDMFTMVRNVINLKEG